MTPSPLLPSASIRAPTLEPAAPIPRFVHRVPVRHWAFSLGVAARPEAARVCMDAVFSWLRRAAARSSLSGPHACAAVSTMRRPEDDAGSTIDLHALVLDGVYTRDGGEAPVFHPLPGPRRRDDRRLVAALRLALEGRLGLRRCRARAVHRVVTGPVAHRSGDLALPPGALDPSRLRHRLAHPFADGTTHVELSLPELAAHLRSLTAEPRPEVTAHGMLTPKSAAAWQERGFRCDTPLQTGGPGREESEAA